MSYDPALPANGSPLDSAEMRSQLTALHDLIQARPTTPEVQSEIGVALQGTSDNSNAVAPLSMSADTSYQQSQIQQIADKIDELINALRR